jgi:2-aminoethylphosphonate-pyruvate transaminase
MNMHPRPSFHGPDGQEDMPFLLTPGPLTTSQGVKLAMLADWGSRDIEFREMVRDIRTELCGLAGCDKSFDCVPMQGSGTFAIEAALGSLAPDKVGKTLVIANGAYGDRAADILEKLKRPYIKIDKGDNAAPQAHEVRPLLDADRNITHVWMVHCETTSGIVNPVSEIAAAVKSAPRVFMVDAMSSFGALPLNMVRDKIDVMVSSSNKCIEGVPGFSYVILRRDLLTAAAGKSHSVVLDLHAQWQGLENNGQFRFTPPTHVLAAFRQALRELEDEGGIEARFDRYRRNADILVDGLKRMGITPLLSGEHAGPIIQTFLSPRDPNFIFERFYDLLRVQGFAIYPGKLTRRPSFRIGTIGKLDTRVMERVLEAIEGAFREMGVRDTTPAAE